MMNEISTNKTMGKEEVLTMAVSDYLKYQYPKVLFCHIANERKTSPARGAKFKRMGVRKGMPDFLIFNRGGGLFIGLAIELKIRPNKITPSQQEVLGQLYDAGWFTRVCYDFDETKNIIDRYLGLRSTKRK